IAASERLLDRLLTLARGVIAPGDRRPVPLDQIARRRLAATDEAASKQELTLRCELSEATAYGDPWLLGELADNLLDNAIKYNRHHGWITMSPHTDARNPIFAIPNHAAPL